MKVRLVVLLLLCCATAAVGQKAVCPWFTSGSAVRILGGEVTVTAHSENNWEGSCRLVRGVGDSAQTIEITVSKTKTEPCPAGSVQLKALGNEAVQCRRPEQQIRLAYTIAGRVRDAYFAVTMTNVPQAVQEAPADARPSDNFSASILERVAEQVAGNLY